MKQYTDGKTRITARNKRQAAMFLNCELRKVRTFKNTKTMKTSTFIDLATHPAAGMSILIIVALFGLYKFGLHKDIYHFLTGKN